MRIFPILARVSPRFAQFAKESYHTLNGWRFDDIKKHISLEKAASSTLALESTFQAAKESSHESDRTAFITCLPPDDTGIATCSLHSWLGAQVPVDIFCPVSDLDWFFSLSHRLRGDDGNGPRLFDVGGFLTLDAKCRYKHIVVAVGNSNHHLYIFNLLKKLASVGPLDRVILYIHDPCMLNLVERGTTLSELAFRHTLEEIYAKKLSRPSANEYPHDSLVRQGVFGVRYFYSLGIDKFIVNSEAASKIIKSDIGNSRAVVKTIYHPVFLPAQHLSIPLMNRSGSRIVIGTFGEPGQAKRTDDVIAVADLLQRKGHKVKLLIAGFKARRFTERYDNALRNIEHSIFEGPTDFQLIQCMSECDVAIQLRKRNLGESSGIVPQLLSLGKSVC